MKDKVSRVALRTRMWKFEDGTAELMSAGILPGSSFLVFGIACPVSDGKAFRSYLICSSISTEAPDEL